LNSDTVGFKKALAYSLKLLTIKQRGIHELASKLHEKQFSDSVVGSVIKELQRLGMLDDRQYAENVTRTLQRHKHYGLRRVEYELKKKGIAGADIGAVLNESVKEGEKERAVSIALTKWNQEQSKRHYTQNELLALKKKIYDYLVRRGFDFETARAVVYELPQ
jgi:regulatory protein